MEENSEKFNRFRYKKININSLENTLLTALIVLALLFSIQLFGTYIHAAYANVTGKILAALDIKS